MASWLSTIIKFLQTLFGGSVTDQVSTTGTTSTGSGSTATSTSTNTDTTEKNVTLQPIGEVELGGIWFGKAGEPTPQTAVTITGEHQHVFVSVKCVTVGVVMFEMYVNNVLSYTQTFYVTDTNVGKTVGLAFDWPKGITGTATVSIPYGYPEDQLKPKSKLVATAASQYTVTVV